MTRRLSGRWRCMYSPTGVGATASCEHCRISAGCFSFGRSARLSDVNVTRAKCRAIVGSLNQDPRSRIHNREIWLTVRNPGLAAELGALFDEASDAHHAYKLVLADGDEGQRVKWHTQERGQTIVLSDEPSGSPWLKLWRAVLGALVPEHLL